LRDTTSPRRNAGEFELSEKIVILGQRTFTLENLDQDSGLVVSSSGEAICRCQSNVRRNEREKIIHLTLPCGDDGVTRNQLGEDTTSSLDTEAKRANINENNFSSSFGAREDSTLNSGTVSDGLIRVDSLGRFLATEEFLEELLNFGDTGRSSNENDL
jgi:NAD-specific glutamate dehydrogenase